MRHVLPLPYSHSVQAYCYTFNVQSQCTGIVSPIQLTSGARRGAAVLALLHEGGGSFPAPRAVVWMVKTAGAEDGGMDDGIDEGEGYGG